MKTTHQASLLQMDGYSFPVFHSEGAGEQCRQYATRCAAASAFLNEALGFTPELVLLTLAPEDWDTHAGFPMYGMPHTARDKEIVVGTELGEFWDPIVQMIDEAVTPEEFAGLVEIHGIRNAQLDFTSFNDLLSVHELGHLYHQQVPFNFPRLWLMELFANLCVHAYIAAHEPDRMPIWTSLPEHLMAAPLDRLQHRSLADFERLYVGVGGDNYVWYQYRFVVGIINIFDDGGVGILQNLYHACRGLDGTLTDDELARFLEERVHPGLADLMRNWPQ